MTLESGDDDAIAQSAALVAMAEAREQKKKHHGSQPRVCGYVFTRIRLVSDYPGVYHHFGMLTYRSHPTNGKVRVSWSPCSGSERAYRLQDPDAGKPALDPPSARKRKAPPLASDRRAITRTGGITMNS